MKRVLTELTPECELTTQMYISGLEKEDSGSEMQGVQHDKQPTAKRLQDSPSEKWQGIMQAVL